MADVNQKDNRGGARRGAGRPKGKTKKTLERERVKRELDQRIMRASDMLANAQLSLAKGTQFLYRIDKEFVQTGVNKKTGEKIGYYKNLKPVVVVDQWEIEAYLDELAENNGQLDDDKDSDAAYYYITTKEPNNMAIDSLLNRVHGKPKEQVEFSGEVKFSLKDLATRRAALRTGETEKIRDAEFTETVALPEGAAAEQIETS